MFEAVIGLEVHVQLRAATKMFCRCPNRYGAEPNTLVCPICLGYPGALPSLNERAVELAARLALALGAEVHPRSIFARKSYFYPDLPKGYQITQLEAPLATGGALPLADGRRIGLRRLHLEEDAGKLLHAEGGSSRIDFNRAGVPLVELVTEPELATAGEAQELLQTLHRLLLFTATSDGNLEEGSLRCDANVSLHRPGEPFGTRVEVKNLNSFRYLARALGHEIERQTALLESGTAVVGETRGFDVAAGVTHPLRDKEDSPDYRYFPEPDLPPLVLDEAWLATLAAGLAELPWRRQARLAAAWGIGDRDASALLATPQLADYVERAVAARPASARAIAHWVRTEVLRGASALPQDLAAAPSPERLAAVVGLVEDGAVAAAAGKRLLQELGDDETPLDGARRRGLLLARGEDELEGWVDAVLAAHPAEVERYRAGKTALLGFFVGKAVAASRGRAAPQRVGELLRRKLETEAALAGGDGGR